MARDRSVRRIVWLTLSSGALLISVSMLVLSNNDHQSAQVPPATVYITWDNYRGWEDPDTAVILFNGRSVGNGAKGGLAAAKELLSLPEKSTVLIQPVYMLADDNQGRHTPIDLGVIADAARQRRMKLVLSYRRESISGGKTEEITSVSDYR